MGRTSIECSCCLESFFSLNFQLPTASKHANTGYLKIFLTIVAFLPLACSAATVQTLDGKN